MLDCGRIIFVDTDNTGLSVMAEAIMERLCGGRPEILSRGLVVLFPEPLNPAAVDALQEYGLTPTKACAEGLQPADGGEDTMVLTMTDRQAEQVKALLHPDTRVYTLGRFAGKAVDLEAPYGGGLESYKRCCEYVDFLVKLAAEKLFREV